MKKLIIDILIVASCFSNATMAQTKALENRMSFAETISQTQPDSAKILLNQIYIESTNNKNTPIIVRSLNELGVLYYYLGQYDTSLTFYFRAKEYFALEEMPSLKATVNSNIGALYKSIGLYDKALALYKEALEIDKKTKDTTKIAVRLNNIAGIYAIWGKYDLAIEYYLKALKYDQILGNKEAEAIRYGNIGVIYYRLNQFDSSVDYLQKALKIDLILGNEFNIAIRLNNLGRTYVSMNGFNKAKDYYRQAIAINKRHGNNSDLAVSYSNLGNVFLALNNKDSSLYYLEKALQLALETGSKSQEQNILNALGNHYKYFKQYTEAIRYYKKSLELTEYLKIINEQAFVTKSLSDVYNFLGDYYQSNHLLREYVVLQDSIQTLNSADKLAQLQVKYSIEQKENQIENLQREKHEKELKISNQRWIIFLIVVFSFLLVFIIIVLYRMRLLKERRAKLIIENRLVKYMQKAYRQQMNPHFVFNTLNSIQSFILKNDKESSSIYLSKFAHLMRMVLENSEKEMILLKDELEAVKIYLELEKLRFEKDIRILINVDDDLLECLLPPLIFQPFIENAIWHGFAFKEGEAEIQINIDVKQSNLICEIIDNGIGRVAAEKYKKKTYQSFGKAITKKRLELFNTKHKADHKMLTVDLYNSNQEPIGTKVMIKIPLIEN